MAHHEAKIAAEKREKTGTTRSRQLRRQGKIPVNLFGLGQGSMSLTVSSDDITPVVISGVQVVDVDFDGNEQKAVIREVQWDTFLTHILHVELQRVDPNARVDLEVPLETRGVVNEGVLEQLLHTIPVNCPVFKIPDTIQIRVSTMNIGDEVTVADLELDPSVRVELDEEDIILRLMEVMEAPALEEEEEAAAEEPELIGEKKEEGEEEGGEATE